MIKSRPNNGARIDYLDSIRAVAVFMVVGIHTMGYVKIDGLEKTLIAFFVHTVGVPVFFLVDGIILSRQCSGSPQLNYWQYIAKSARRLLIPWSVFNMLYLVLRAIFEYFGFLEIIIINSSYWEILKALYSSDISNQMYFLLSLFFIRTFAFAWDPLINARAWIIGLVWVSYTLIVSFMAPHISKQFPLGLDPFLHAIMGLRFYLLGFVVFRYQELIKRYSFWLVSITLLGGVLLRYFTNSGIHVQLPLLLCLYISFLCFFNKKNILSIIGRFTMGIYLLHIPIILKGLSIIILQVSGGGGAAFMMVLISAFVVSLTLAKVLDSLRIWRLMLGEKP